MQKHECPGQCGQVWEVYEVEDRQDDEAEFTIYATRTIPDGRFPVQQGQDFFEQDICPTCEAALEELVLDPPLRR
jgi:hypothetical protein